MPEGNLGIHVTDWSEVRVLPEEHERASGESASLAQVPIDTTVEPMFYASRARLSGMWRGISCRACARGKASRSSGTKTLCRLPAVSRAETAPQAGNASGEVAHLCIVRQEILGEATGGRQDPLSLSTSFLSGLLAVRDTQHVEDSPSPSFI